jgi:glucosamine--fructose-6-phosphate aminotransferase (isomerizing)
LFCGRSERFDGAAPGLWHRRRPQTACHDQHVVAAADWHTPDYPELRSGPPWVMAEMMAAQPPLGRLILGEPTAAVVEVAQAVRASLARGDAVTVCGCGTSEHGAMGVAALLRAAVGIGERDRIRAVPALSAAFEPSRGLCLAVSHDGGTRATRLALEAGAAAGAWNAAITARPDGEVAAVSKAVIVTPVVDRSWCHTVAYTSALLAGAAIARSLGLPNVDGDGASAAIGQTLGLRGFEPIASALAPGRVVLCAGAGIDQITARELALKIAEGARMPTLGIELETLLHGQLAGHEPSDRLIVVSVASGPNSGRSVRRLEDVTRAASAIGIPVAGLLCAAHAERFSDELTPAGRVVIPAIDGLDGTLDALLGGGGGAQALTLALVGARGTNPDLIRREEAPYRNAALVAEAAADW